MTNAFQKREFRIVSTDRKLQEDLKELVYKSLNRICENDKIYISICTPPEFVKKLEILHHAEKFHDVNWNILRKQSDLDHEGMIPEDIEIKKYTQRMLIDLKEPAGERFQLEVLKSDIMGNLRLETVQKIKNYLSNKADTNVLEQFRLSFNDYHVSTDPD